LWRRPYQLIQEQNLDPAAHAMVTLIVAANSENSVTLSWPESLANEELSTGRKTWTFEVSN
jgi:hypothetical protein